MLLRFRLYIEPRTKVTLRMAPDYKSPMLLQKIEVFEYALENTAVKIALASIRQFGALARAPRDLLPSPSIA